jgi:hypothetical protein
MNEAFYDRQGSEVDEDDIKAIFNILLNPAQKEQPAPEPEEKEPNEAQARKIDQMRRLKQMIRDSMTPQQRKALYRALLHEA